MSRSTRLNPRVTKADAAPAIAGTAALSRPPTPLGRARVKSMVQCFSPGHGWAAAGNYASAPANYTSDALFGTQCFQIVTGTTSQEARITKTGLTLDASASSVRLVVKYDSAASLQYLDLRLGTGGMTNYYSCRVMDYTNSTQAVGFPERPGDWAVIDLPRTAFTAVGAPSWASISDIAVVAIGKWGQAATVRLSAVALVAESTDWPSGVVTISMDDTYTAQGTLALPRMDLYGFKATLFPIIDTSGGSGDTYSLDQLKVYRDQGHEIGAHASSLAIHSVGLDGLSQAARVAELETLRTWQVNNNFGSESLAWPIGGWSSAAATDVAKYYSSARLAKATRPQTPRPGNPWAIQCMDGQASSLATLQSAVDAAKTGKGWLCIYYHSFAANKSGTAIANIDDFNSLVDYIAAQGVPVRTQGEVIAAANRT